jgi:hypothetical protein
MEGFKSLPKMAHFKEGGHAKTKEMCGGGRSYKKGGEVECKDDVKEDKKMIKKAFKQHDEAEHDKDNASEIKLKKGGRTKKEKGTVKKYKAGGSINPFEKAGDEDKTKKVKATGDKKADALMFKKEGGKIQNVYEAKKKAGDLDRIEEVKSTKAGKADAKSGAEEMDNKYKAGHKVC